MRGWRRRLLWVVVAALVGGGVGVATRAGGVRPVRVTSDSMSPTMVRGNWFVVRALNQHGPRAIRRGEIVLFRLPFGTTGRAVKRVIALGGDSVAFTDRSVSVNGRVIPVARSRLQGLAGARQRVETVPHGHVFVMGDNTAVSYDSRSFGTVPENELVGRVLLVFPRWSPRPTRGDFAKAVAGCFSCLLGALLLLGYRMASHTA